MIQIDVEPGSKVGTVPGNSHGDVILHVLVDNCLQRERRVLARLIDLLDFQFIAVDGRDLPGKYRSDSLVPALERNCCRTGKY
jgi:hypothetical protein